MIVGCHKECRSVFRKGPSSFPRASVRCKDPLFNSLELCAIIEQDGVSHSEGQLVTSTLGTTGLRLVLAGKIQADKGVLKLAE